MIRVFISSRFARSTRKLSDEKREQIASALAAVGRDFGNPHSHSGLGLRKIGARYWECRIGLDSRIVFRLDADGLLVYAVVHRGEKVEVQRHGKTIAEIRPKAGVSGAELLRLISDLEPFTEAEKKELREAMTEAGKVFGYAGSH